METEAIVPVFLKDQAATETFGRRLAGDLTCGGMVCLFGGLGAGKTALARAIIGQLQRSAGGKSETVPSPTYTLLQTYEAGALVIRHFDLFRIEKPDDVYELGWEEALEGGLVLIEWPERLGPLLPGDRLEIHLNRPPGGGREVRLEQHGAWTGRTVDVLA